MQAGSPVKESSFLNQETNAEDLEGNDSAAEAQTSGGDAQAAAGAGPGPGNQAAIPIRR